MIDSTRQLTYCLTVEMLFIISPYIRLCYLYTFFILYPELKIIIRIFPIYVALLPPKYLLAITQQSGFYPKYFSCLKKYIYHNYHFCYNYNIVKTHIICG